MALNRPRGRQKNISGGGKSIYKRGSGLGTGPVGSSGGYSGRPSGGGFGGGSGRGSRGPRNTRGGGGLGKIAINYGYYRYQDLVMDITVILLILIVELLQAIGSFLAKKLDKRNK